MNKFTACLAIILTLFSTGKPSPKNQIQANIYVRNVDLMNTKQYFVSTITIPESVSNKILRNTSATAISEVIKNDNLSSKKRITLNEILNNFEHTILLVHLPKSISAKMLHTLKSLKYLIYTYNRHNEEPCTEIDVIVTLPYEEDTQDLPDPITIKLKTGTAVCGSSQPSETFDYEHDKQKHVTKKKKTRGRKRKAKNVSKNPRARKKQKRK